MIGKAVGSYTITRKLGHGGMGAVYLAEHALIGRKAAIKMLLPELSHNEEVVGRLFNEARATTAIKHPGIIEVFDFGYHHDGSAYLVMEYLEGESLRDRLKRLGKIEPELAVHMTIEVCAALASAHDKNIIHRDLKPDNLFIVAAPDRPNGERIKILDFGIAKLAADDDTGSGSGSHRTRTGAVLGTPAYMAPEQCKGAGEVDARADFYSIGCILFHLVCGRPPFKAPGGGEVLAAHIYEPPPPPSAFDPNIWPQLEAVILRLLEKRPERRYQSAAEIIAALEHALGARGQAPIHPVARHASAPISIYDTAPTVDSRPGAMAENATTLSSASHVSIPPRESRGGFFGVVAIAAVVAVAAGIVIALSIGGGDSAARPDAAIQASAPPVEPDAAPAPAVEPDAAPAPDPAPSTVDVVIRSTPRATVYALDDGMKKVGKTPYRAELPARKANYVFLLERRRFDNEYVFISGERGGTETRKLRRLRAGEKPKSKTTAAVKKAAEARSGKTTKPEPPDDPGPRFDRDPDEEPIRPVFGK